MHLLKVLNARWIITVLLHTRPTESEIPHFRQLKYYLEKIMMFLLRECEINPQEKQSGIQLGLKLKTF